MGAPEQFDLFDDERGDDAEMNENTEWGEMDEKNADADKALDDAVKRSTAKKKNDLISEIYQQEPRKIGPGRKEALELLEKFRNEKK